MTQRQQLYQAILENPEDTSRRLIYADWLDENGNEPDRAQAEYIRIEIELEEISVSDSRRESLLERRWELKTEYEETWFGELFEIAEEVDYERGVPNSLTLSVRDFVENAERIFQLAPIRDGWFLEVEANAEALARCPFFSRFETLGFSHFGEAEQLSSSVMKVLTSSPHFPKLKELWLGGCNIESEGLVAVLAVENLASLEELDVGECEIDDAGCEAFVRASHIRSLKQLDLKRNAVSEIGVQHLASSQHLAGLEELDLSHNPLGNPGVTALASASHLTNLSSLRLMNVAMSHTGMLALAGSDILEGLETLILCHNFIGDMGLEFLLSSKHLSSLSFLSLTGTGIESLGIQRLVELWPFENLKTLYLDYNSEIDGEGLQAFFASPKIATLESLNLSSTNPGKDGLRALANSPYVAEIDEIRFEANDVGDWAVDILLESPYIAGKSERLVLGFVRSDHEISDEGIKRLKDKVGDAVYLGGDVCEDEEE